MRILFAIGIAVSALLLTSCSNPDTSGGVAVTMSRDNASEFPDGSCEGPGKFTDELNTGCGWIYLHDRGYYIRPFASVYRANLLGANLMRANLSIASLIGANLYGANLNSANLNSANLSVANLMFAILSDANLIGANLRGVDLLGANLYGANLNSANLKHANLRGAQGNSSTTCPNGRKWGTAGNNCGF